MIKENENDTVQKHNTTTHPCLLKKNHYEWLSYFNSFMAGDVFQYRFIIALIKMLNHLHHIFLVFVFHHINH